MLIVGFGGLVLVGGLLIWAGVSALNYFTTSAAQIAASASTSDQIENLKAEMSQVQFQPWNCWLKTQSLLNLQPWIERPTMDNFILLKQACLRQKNEGVKL